MKIPNQSIGAVRTNFSASIHAGIAPALRIGNTEPAPRACADCDLLFWACRAVGESDCASEYISCRFTCTGPLKARFMA